MLAAVLTNYNSPLELWDIEWGPIQFGQVRVQVLSSGICGAQLQEIRGEKGTHLPRLMGHEGVGIVKEIGPGVKTVSAGDKVVMHWRKGDGIESESPEWFSARGGYVNTAGQITTFSRETVVSENRVTKVWEHCSDDLSVLLGCSLSTALGVLENDAELRIGETLLIIGAGGLGMALLFACQSFSPSHVVIVDNKPKIPPSLKQNYYLWFGPDWNSKLTCRFDVVIDTTGDPEALEAALERLNPSGRLIMVGQPMKPFTVKQGRRLFSGEGVQIKATQGGGFQPERDIPRYISLDRDFSGIITHRVPLEEINRGLDLVRNGEAGRVLIEM